MIAVLPAGFRFADGVLVNAGPADPAAGRFAELTAPALWSRQVLTDGRLRAVAVVPPAAGPEPFQAVHATAERVAADLGIGAVEVAVCWAEHPLRHADRGGAGWRVAALTGPGLLLLVTDAALDAPALARALSTPDTPDTALLLASAAGAAPDPHEFAAACAELAGAAS